MGELQGHCSLVCGPHRTDLNYWQGQRQDLRQQLESRQVCMWRHRHVLDDVGHHALPDGGLLLAHVHRHGGVGD